MSPDSCFPDPRTSDADTDVVCVGTDLSAAILLDAYSNGIFPWAENSKISWLSPRKRAVLYIEDLHISRSFSKVLKSHSWQITRDTAYVQVINKCAGVKRKNDAKWLNDEIIEAYVDLHELGYAHSIEVWSEDHDERQLVGGVYYVDIAGVISAESMFHTVPNTSKVALSRLCEEATAVGRPFVDVQYLGAHLEAFGAKEIPQSEFLSYLG